MSFHPVFAAAHMSSWVRCCRRPAFFESRAFKHSLQGRFPQSPSSKACKPRGGASNLGEGILEMKPTKTDAVMICYDQIYTSYIYNIYVIITIYIQTCCVCSENFTHLTKRWLHHWSPDEIGSGKSKGLRPLVNKQPYFQQVICGNTSYEKGVLFITFLVYQRVDELMNLHQEKVINWLQHVSGQTEQVW